MTGTKISPEVIAALRVIREQDRGPEFRDAMSVLDNAGIFAEIDATTECTCTCPRNRVIFPTPLGNDMHTVGCPGE